MGKASKAIATEKVGKVITSCKTIEQYFNAQNYVDLFYEMYIYPTETKGLLSSNNIIVYNIARLLKKKYKELTT